MVDAGGVVIWLRSAREDLVRGTVVVVVVVVVVVPYSASLTGS